MINQNLGANIRCCRCGAMPYPAELGFPDARESFDLTKLAGRQGKNGEGNPIAWLEPAGPNEGSWFCELEPERRQVGKRLVLEVA